MDIQAHPPGTARAMLERFEAEGLIYGAGAGYPGLIAPSASVLSPAEAAGLAADLPLLWELYRVWNALYRESLAGAAPAWVARLCEHGLGPAELRAQRITLEAGLEPRMARVDYVGAGAGRAVAEVQWKSGGLGLFFGLAAACAAAGELPGAAPLGDPAGALRALVERCARGGEPVAANGVREVWFRGEHFLRRRYDRRGMRYVVFDRREAAARLLFRGGRLLVSEGGALLPVDFLYGQEALAALPPEALVRLAQAAAEGALWVETPINYVYRQKWGLALPFMPAYSRRFSEGLRAILPPTALLAGPQLDLEPLAAAMPAAAAARLRAVRALDDLAGLPESLRRGLVLKCGGGSGAYYSQGRGVFRLLGSRAAARRTLAFVGARVAAGEPWIIQRYIDITYPLELSPPWAPEAPQRISAHARLMVYGCLGAGGRPALMGGLGNYGRDWKVSGKDAGLDAAGRLTGTAFNDLRVG